MQKDKENSQVNLQHSKQDFLPNIQSKHDFSHLPTLAKAVESLVGSSNSRFKSAADLVLAAQWAIDTGVSLSTVLNKGYVLNGKVSVEYPVLLAILAMNGVIVTEIEDCRPLYNYSQKEFQIDQDTYDANKDKYEVFGSVAEFSLAVKKELIDNKKIQLVRSKQPYDYRTTLQGKRMVLFNGKLEEVVKTVSFSYQDAITAELGERDVYRKYLSDMLMGKAVPRLCWRIGADFVHGAIDNATAFEINNKQYDYSEVDKEQDAIILESTTNNK